MLRPISPSEVCKTPPDAVIEAFNTLITKYLNRGMARVYRNEVIRTIVASKNLNGMDNNTSSLWLEHDINSRQQIVVAEHWLDIDSLYEASGWKVSYVKPDLGETHDPYWIFRQ